MLKKPPSYVLLQAPQGIVFNQQKKNITPSLGSALFSFSFSILDYPSTQKCPC